MNPDDFISAIVKCVHAAAVNDTISVLAEGPAGRKPPALLVELSAWFNELPKADRERLHQVVEQAVHSALFGVLCVVDGVRPIDNSDEKVKHQLLASREGESDLPGFFVPMISRKMAPDPRGAHEEEPIH